MSTITLSPAASLIYNSQWQAKLEIAQNLETHNVYVQGGPAAQAIDARVQTIFAQGWKCVGDDEELNKALQEALEAADWELHARQAVRDGYLYRFGVHELAKANDGSTVLVTRSSRDFAVKEDAKGQIEFLQQHLPGAYSTKPIELPPDKAVMIIPIPTSSGRGVSLFIRAKKQIDWHFMVNQASADSIWRHGYPKYEINLADENGQPVPQAAIDGMEGATSDLGPRSELLMNATSKIVELDKGGVPQVESYGKWALTELCAAIGTPEELLGLGAGSTEATANVKLQAFYDQCYADGCTIAAQYQRQYIDRVLLPTLKAKPGASRLAFNHPNPLKLLQIAQTLQAIVAVNPMDPEFLISRDEQLGLLGFRKQSKDPKAIEPEEPATEQQTLEFQRRAGR